MLTESDDLYHPMAPQSHQSLQVAKSSSILPPPLPPISLPGSGWPGTHYVLGWV